MKKPIAIIICVVILIAIIVGVVFAINQRTANNSDKVKVIATLFPQYDFIKEIGQDKVDVELLLPSGIESHTFEPTPQNMVNINQSDLFVYTGEYMEPWAKTISEGITSDTKVLDASKNMNLIKTEEFEEKNGLEHSHDHSHGDETFEDSEVQDRPLSDWQGDWQSVYPYLTDGTLEPVMKAKAEAEDADKTQQEYYQYYETGYQTDVERIEITDNTMKFYKNGVASEATYQYSGFKILTYESGNKGVRYLFEAVEETSGAPKFIQFSDHGIVPTKAEHYHIYMGDTSHEALLEEMDNWPTYYGADLSKEEIAEEMLAHEGHGDHDHEHEYDPHIWLDPKNAIQMVKNIKDMLMEIDVENAEFYKKNADAYIEKLNKVDTQIETAVKQVAEPKIAFGGPFAYAYFMERYQIQFVSAYDSCGESADPSVAKVKEVIDEVNKDNLPVIFHAELSEGKVAKTIAEETGAKPLVFHSIHNVSKDDIQNGVTYISLMEQNLSYLKEALRISE